MAKLYRFDCSRCGYSARVAGDTQEGINLITATIECLDCRRLYNVITRAKTVRKVQFPNKPGFASGLKGIRNEFGNGYREGNQPSHIRGSNLANPGESLYYTRPRPNSRWQEFPMKCPASKFHRIRPWKEPGRCPKCKNYMQRSPVAYRFWE